LARSPWLNGRPWWSPWPNEVVGAVDEVVEAAVDVAVVAERAAVDVAVVAGRAAVDVVVVASRATNLARAWLVHKIIYGK